MAGRLVHSSAFFFAAFAASAGSARAALYEFTLEGVVTASLVEPLVSAGDPFTVQFVADDRDLFPDPFSAYFPATDATISFPNVTQKPDPTAFAGLEIARTTNADFVSYSSGGPGSAFSSFAFPAGTLVSDSLPLTLPLSVATSTTFSLGNLSLTLVRGRMTSYGGAPVPEPGTSAFIIGAIVVLAARRPMTAAWEREGADHVTVFHPEASSDPSVRDVVRH